MILNTQKAPKTHMKNPKPKQSTNTQNPTHSTKKQ